MYWKILKWGTIAVLLATGALAFLAAPSADNKPVSNSNSSNYRY